MITYVRTTGPIIRTFNNYIKDRLTCSRTIRSSKCHSDISSQGTSCSGTHHHRSSISSHKVRWALNTNLHSWVWKENAHRLHFCRGNFWSLFIAKPATKFELYTAYHSTQCAYLWRYLTIIILNGDSSGVWYQHDSNVPCCQRNSERFGALHHIITNDRYHDNLVCIVSIECQVHGHSCVVKWSWKKKRQNIIAFCITSFVGRCDYSYKVLVQTTRSSL